jgi:predicted XRE-type DNA-binding protein
MAKVNKAVVEVSSGNVFTDLGLAGAKELGTKLRLCVVVNRILETRGLTQVEAARVLGVTQPKISALMSYKLEGFSVERLMHFVTALEHDVVIEIRPKMKKRDAKVMVVSAA